MNHYILTLGLALGDARAEEPKECIDEVVLHMEARPSVQDTAPLFFSEEVLNGVQRLYASVGVSLHAGDSCNQNKKCLKIDVMYGSPNDLLDEWFPNLKTYNEFARNNGDYEVTEEEGGYDLIIFSAPYRRGIADRARQRVFIRELGWYDYNNNDKRIYAVQQLKHIIAHEIGHIFGLEHPDNPDVAGDPAEFLAEYGDISLEPLVNIMRSSGDPSGAEDFSDEDKQKILDSSCNGWCINEQYGECRQE